MSDFYSVERINLSKIGILLRDKLGDDAEQYVFPDEFEKAVIDSGFKAIVYEGDTDPYDATVIGNVSFTAMLMTGINRNSNRQKIKTINYIGVGNNSYVVPENFCAKETSLTTITLPVNTVKISQFAFNGCTALTTINNLSNVTEIGTRAFSSVPIETLILPSVISFPADDVFTEFTGKNIYLLSAQSYRNSTFKNCTLLENVQLGSIGHPVTNVTGGSSNGAFYGCTQGGLTITCYAQDTYIDTAITNIRNCATNAVIIIKAPSGLTYNGNSYDAGDTVVTSNP